MDEQINIDSVNTEFIDNYINKNCLASGLSFGTRSNYKNSLTAFFNHIDSEFNYDTKFCIGKIKVSSIKTDFNTEEKIDWLDATNIIKVNKEILNYPFNKKQNEFEMHRDILIFKLFLFSGILPNEMAELTLDSFILDNNQMVLNIKGTGSKKRSIPLPREGLLSYYENYLFVRSSLANNFFYSPTTTDNIIDKKFLSIIVKRLLEFSDVQVKDMTPKMLRKTYAIVLNNEKGSDGFTQPEKNIQYLLGITNITVLREILKYHSIELSTSSSAFGKLL